MIICKIPIGNKFTLVRLSLFNSLLIDYTAIALRTLGHFSSHNTHYIWDYISYVLACFTLGCFSCELGSMYIRINCPNFYFNKVKGKKEEGLREVYFEGIAEEKLKSSWFARNYNFLYLMRFMVICVLIFNLQYLQIFQVFMSLVFMVIFCIITFRKVLKDDFFKSKFVKVFRLIQEVSMAVIVLLINIFCYDSFKSNLQNSQKVVLVLIFVGLLVLNILLEITACVISMASFLRKSCQGEKKEKKKLKKAKSPKPNRSIIKANLGKREVNQITQRFHGNKNRMQMSMRHLTINRSRNKKFSVKFKKGKFFGSSRLLGRNLYRSRRELMKSSSPNIQKKF
jgi:hypothetical protein